MKKLITLIAILFATQPLVASASLYSYYQELGSKLPTISERALLYAEIADDAYYGTAKQNNLLESYLRGGELGAVTPQPRLLGDNTWSGTNTFSGTTTLGTTTVNNLISNGLNQYFTAGENITAGQALIIGLSSSTSRVQTIGSTNDAYLPFNGATTLRYGQSFTTPATGVDGKYVSTYQLNSVSISGNEPGPGSFSVTFTVDIYLAGSNDLPTGSVLYTTTSPSYSSDTFTGVGVVFTNAYLNPNTKYVVVFTASYGTGAEYLRFTTENDNPYSGGKVIVSSDSGSTWASYSTGNFDMVGNVTYTENEMTTGSVYTAKAGTTNVNFYKNFIGFAYNNAVTSSQVLVTTNGIVNNLSGLNTGRTYYIGSTFGTVTSTDPTNSAKVGLAVSSTQLLIKHDNP